MDQLPQELIDRILDFIPVEPRYFSSLGRGRPNTNRPGLATVSRKFRASIERLTFASCSLDTLELDTFAQIYRHPHRRRCLKRLNYTPILDEQDAPGFFRYEREWERRRNDECFTKAIRRLFRLLRDWEDEDQPGAIRLALSIHSPVSVAHKEPLSRDQNSGNPERSRRQAVPSQRWEFSRLRLLDPWALPEVRCIHNFRGPDLGRYLDLPACAKIASRLPGLEATDWLLQDNDRLYPERRQRARGALGHELRWLAGRLRNLKKARIRLHHTAPLNQELSLPSLLSHGHDHFSSAVCAFSQNLTSLSITGVVDAGLFTPRNPAGTSTPFWPHLQRLSVQFDMVSPSGTWYFKGHELKPPPSPFLPNYSTLASPPLETDALADEIEMGILPMPLPLSLTGDGPDYHDEQHLGRLAGFWPLNIFRVIPDDDTLRPLLVAFAKAAANEMPSLREADIGTQIKMEDGTDARWYIEWLSSSGVRPKRHLERTDGGQPGVQEANREPDPASPQSPPRFLRWGVGPWRPDEEVGALLRSIGRERFGDGLDEKFVGLRQVYSCDVNDAQ